MSWQTQNKVSTTDVAFCHIPLAVVIIKLISIAHDRSATTEPKRKPTSQTELSFINCSWSQHYENLWYKCSKVNQL